MDSEIYCISLRRTLRSSDEINGGNSYCYECTLTSKIVIKSDSID